MPLSHEQKQVIASRLRERRAIILSMTAARSDSSATVELDQTRTGRLSRMDALQLQAMAKAGESRAARELQRIEAALRRVDNGEFGECLDCGGEIGAGRLEADPAAAFCVGCAERREA